MAKRTSGKPGSSKKAVTRAKFSDESLREHLLYLLRGGGAHIGFDEAFKDWPARLTSAKVASFPHTAWMLLEHMRLAQRDILEFSRNAKYASKAWPEDYWPQNEAPPDANAWSRSVQAFRKDLTAMQDLVSSPKTDLYAHIPWGDGQTILREALLVADHNAYHLGQLVDVLRLLGSWQG